MKYIEKYSVSWSVKRKIIESVLKKNFSVDQWLNSPKSSSLSSRLASRLSFRSCRSISWLIRFCSLASSDRQHAIAQDGRILDRWRRKRGEKWGGRGRGGGGKGGGGRRGREEGREGTSDLRWWRAIAEWRGSS